MTQEIKKNIRKKNMKGDGEGRVVESFPKSAPPPPLPFLLVFLNLHSGKCQFILLFLLLFFIHSKKNQQTKTKEIFFLFHTMRYVLKKRRLSLKFAFQIETKMLASSLAVLCHTILTNCHPPIHPPHS